MGGRGCVCVGVGGGSGGDKMCVGGVGESGAWGGGWEWGGGIRYV